MKRADRPKKQLKTGVSGAASRVLGCRPAFPFYSCHHVKRANISSITALALGLVAWLGTGCGGFNANVPVSPLWFIQQPAPGTEPVVDSPESAPRVSPLVS
jgi:hypothetical protein